MRPAALYYPNAMTSETKTNAAPRTNVPELSVSELAFSLKRTLEDSYSHVRVRGELSRVKIHTSGHLYTDIKDDKAVINAVCWKGTVSKLGIKPEEGLEVICTGRISTYPARSNYQLIIESMELAGEGALLKMLEERRKKLTEEGLFAEERKKKLPFLPDVIGVITSPTGAVIRDIMHRLNDRFPRHVLLWPVLVQGDGAADQIAAAINGFNAMTPGGAVPRPDLLIVARGGGSLEDLMAFNEENVVRAVADCDIPVISAVGHETDTTLIDYAADKRAPTPTGAAEIAVPQRLELIGWVDETQHRLRKSLTRMLSERRSHLETLTAKLGDPARLLENRQQHLDHTAHKLRSGFERRLSRAETRIKERGAQLRHPRTIIGEAERTLSYHVDRLRHAGPRLTTEPEKRLKHSARMLETLSFKSVLSRGYVVVRDQKGTPITAAGNTKAGQAVRLQFHDSQADAVIAGSTKQPKSTKKAAKGTDQQELF